MWGGGWVWGWWVSECGGGGWGWVGGGRVMRKLIKHSPLAHQLGIMLMFMVLQQLYTAFYLVNE